MFADDIQSFSRNLDALRDFVDLIEPILNERSKSTFKEYRDDLMPFVFAMLQAFPEEDFPKDQISLINIPKEMKLKYRRDFKVEIGDAADEISKTVSLRIAANRKAEYDRMFEEDWGSGLALSVFVSKWIIPVMKY